jgi:hypothetical protein
MHTPVPDAGERAAPEVASARTFAAFACGRIVTIFVFAA